MKFDYKKIAPEIFRPIIPVEVGFNNFFVQYEVLVDSGADLCIFDAEIGEILGMKINSGKPQKVAGITGAQSEVYYLHKIQVKVGGHEYKIEAGFLPNLNSRYNYGVVGQKGFFDLFVVKFDLLKEEVELKQRQ